MSTWTWRTWITSAVVTAAVATGAVVVTSQQSDASAVAVSGTTAGSGSTGGSGAATGAETIATTDAASGDAASADEEPSTEQLEAITTGARFAVSVLDEDTGESLEYGDTATFDTASIVKVDILAALLWQHQEAGTSLTATEQAQATAMIEQSDNTAATALFQAVGGKTGLEAFNTLIGLTDTEVGSNGSWGLTQTTPTDQIHLLEVVLGDGTVLTADSQEYVAGLMSDVVDAQNFGVSAAADDADDAALKVGYLQRSTTGLWDVTSIGEIETAGHTYLVAVLTDGNDSFDAGVALADEIAQAAVSGLG